MKNITKNEHGVINSSEKNSQKQKKKANFQTSMRMIRKTSRSSNCNVTEFSHFRKQKKTHLTPATKQSKKQRLSHLRIHPT